MGSLFIAMYGFREYREYLLLLGCGLLLFAVPFLPLKWLVLVSITGVLLLAIAGEHLSPINSRRGLAFLAGVATLSSMTLLSLFFYNVEVGVIKKLLPLFVVVGALSTVTIADAIVGIFSKIVYKGVVSWDDDIA
ncbi:MAG: hypothetical protein ACXQS2_02035, partial [Methermicoccaceae archaeon]